MTPYQTVFAIKKMIVSTSVKRLPHSYSAEHYKKCPGCDHWIKKKTALCRRCVRKKSFDLEVWLCKPADYWVRVKWRPYDFDETKLEEEEQDNEQPIRPPNFW